VELYVAAVILLFSIIQSIIGVGILLFGTPTLLLMGYSYHETLFLILPSSILISTLQSINSSKLIRDTKTIYLYTLPMVFAGLSIVTFLYDQINIKYMIGGMLIFVGFIRGVPVIRQYLKRFLCNNQIVYNVVMGGVHGVSNMGGGMLVVLMSTLHNKRDVVLVNIAYTYLLFGVIQMITLLLFSQESINADVVAVTVTVAFLSLIIYWLSTKFIVKRVSDMKFDSLITVLIFFYGIISFLNIW